MTLIDPDDPAPPHLLVQIENAGKVSCEGYYDLPIITPGHIAIVAEDSALARSEASLLQQDLRRQILAMPGARSGGSAIPCGGRRDDFDCQAIKRAYSRNVVVVLCATADPVFNGPAVKPAANQTVLVLSPAGTGVPRTPFNTGAINTAHWQHSATEYVPRIFAAAGVSDTGARVFISYRRRDSGPLAEQLFEALAKKNVDVFVDRFRIDVGADFQQRILQELAHKSMMVLIESATVSNSEWTRYEIAVAKSSRIGLLAIHTPNSPTVRDIDDSRRVSVALTPQGELDAATLDAVVNRILLEHFDSQLRRRLLCRQSMQRALNGAGVDHHSVVDGALVVTPNAGSAKRYVAWLPSRAADWSDYHATATHSHASVASCCIVSPAAHLVGRDRQQMRWLSGIAKVRAFDEGQMFQVAKAMKAEVL
jgi:hypothetical protein